MQVLVGLWNTLILGSVLFMWAGWVLAVTAWVWASRSVTRCSSNRLRRQTADLVTDRNLNIFTALGQSHLISPASLPAAAAAAAVPLSLYQQQQHLHSHKQNITTINESLISYVVHKMKSTHWPHIQHWYWSGYHDDSSTKGKTIQTLEVTAWRHYMQPVHIHMNPVQNKLSDLIMYINK